jgi:AcrR family transcriptional regulator
MARVTIPPDRIFDAARSVIVAGGPRALTVDAVARTAPAPVGSIYHRFDSVGELLARAWLRAVHRSQEPALALDLPAGIEAAVAVAVAMYDFCVDQPEDAILLGSVRHADLLRLDLPPEVAHDVEHANDEIRPLIVALARGCFGRADARATDLVVAAIVDLPFGLVRGHLEVGRRPPRARRAALPAAVRAILA